MKIFNVLIFCCVILQVVCGNSQDKKRLDDLTERFFQWRITENPEYGTKIGIHDYDDSVQQYSEEAYSKQLVEAQKFLNESWLISNESLSEQDSITLDVLRNNLQIFIDGYPFRRFGWANLITTMERATSDWERFPSQMLFKTEKDYRIYLDRLSKFPGQIGQKINLMRRAIQNKTTAHQVSLIDALNPIVEVKSFNPNVTTNYQQCRTGAKDDLTNKFIGSDVEKLLLYQPFTRFPSSFSSTLKKNLSDRATFIIEQTLQQPILDLSNFIEQEYTPKTRPEIGVSSLPGGLEYYKSCLKWHTSLDWTPEQIHDKGLKEVARIQGLMEENKNRAGSRGSLKDYMNQLSADRSNYYNTEPELKKGYEEIIENIHSKLKKVLYRTPSQKLIVTKSDNPQARTARYRSPPLDSSRPGELVAKLDNPQNKLKYRMTAIALHEGEPGHHTQFSYTIDEKLPTFRRAIEYRNYNSIPFNWPFYTAYVEGWALYAETLGVELGVYKDEKALFGMYESELFRAARLVIDTGIHAFRWNYSQAVEYLSNHSALSLDECQDEINRYVSWPGQACAYTIGELKIRELRNKSEAYLGPLFDLKKFNHQVLKLGPVPLSVLEGHINRWMIQGKAANVLDDGPNLQPSVTILCTLLSMALLKSFASYLNI